MSRKVKCLRLDPEANKLDCLSWMLAEAMKILVREKGLYNLWHSKQHELHVCSVPLFFHVPWVIQSGSNAVLGVGLYHC